MPVDERNGNVFVAAVLVDVKNSPTTGPATESLAYGDEVPMPRLPPFVRVITLFAKSRELDQPNESLSLLSIPVTHLVAPGSRN
jgi:hypothetical protein